MDILAIALLAAACASGGAPAATSTPAPVSPPPADTATPTALPPGGIEFTAPIDLGPSLLDLVVFDAGNLDRLAPFKELSAGGLPDSISASSLAFYPSYEYELAAHLDDGQLLVWDMSTGATIYRDQHASADSYAGQHPALALDPSFQGYLATSEAIAPGTGPVTASGTVFRRPEDPQTSHSLSGASGRSAGLTRLFGSGASPSRPTATCWPPASATSMGLGSDWDIWDQDQSR
jgi:hypothetical protein